MSSLLCGRCPRNGNGFYAYSPLDGGLPKLKIQSGKISHLKEIMNNTVAMREALADDIMTGEDQPEGDPLQQPKRRVRGKGKAMGKPAAQKFNIAKATAAKRAEREKANKQATQALLKSGKEPFILHCKKEIAKLLKRMPQLKAASRPQ